MVFAEIDVEESFGGQDVDGQSAVPKCNSKAQPVLTFEVDLVPVDGNFQDALEGGLGDQLGIEQADKVLFDGEALDVAALKFHDDGQILSAADGDAKLGVFKLGESFRERIDAHAEAILLETVAQLVQIENATVHRAAATLRRIESGAKPFEIRSVPAVYRNFQQTRWRKLQRVFGPALDGLG